MKMIKKYFESVMGIPQTPKYLMSIKNVIKAVTIMAHREDGMTNLEIAKRLYQERKADEK